MLSCIDPARSWLNRKPGHVIDGTSCDKYTNDICIDGKCVPVGCDGFLYGTKKEDVCGVCNGNADTCKSVDIIKYSTTGDGYKDIQLIPSNSTQVKIEQVGSYPYDKISLSLYDPVRNTVLIICHFGVFGRPLLTFGRTLLDFRTVHSRRPYIFIPFNRTF